MYHEYTNPNQIYRVPRQSHTISRWFMYHEYTKPNQNYRGSRPYLGKVILYAMDTQNLTEITIFNMDTQNLTEIIEVS